MVRITRIPLVGLGVFLGSCLGFAGCSPAPEDAPGKHPPTVTVSNPLQREVTDYQDYTGRTAAVDSVQVQARVTGYLTKIYFKEGEEVKEDTVLYEIDPRPYRAAYDSAKAQVAQNVASLALAKQDNTRFKKLDKDQAGAVTKVDLDKYQSQEDQAVAALEQSQANLETAKLNLDWTKVTAPVTGVIGRLLVTRGNLIVANQTTLTTVVRQDPMWVYFDADEPTVLQVHELIRQGKFGPTDTSTGVPIAKIAFHLQLANEKGFPHEATMDFVNNQLDQATATLQIRGVFPNPKPANGPRVFAPNMFVRVRVPTSAVYQALLVNPEAVGTDQDLKYVYVVDNDNKVVRHNVKLGSLQDGLQVITDGLKLDERVIVKGLQRVQQGATVNATVVPMPMPAQDSLSASPSPVMKAAAPPPKK
ncbi:MAG TPA: efflux RND transporter periplasmic adaptor subunit [Gemmataceae bacterium]|jgi:RND family efflux transporter MFP subunit|nr:efflux RND transporter periplasmic adaptor subunit [Gemmataceae bacterium]